MIQHSESGKHKKIAGGKKGRVTGQPRLGLGDHYWREIFNLLKDAAGGMRQLELELLVKLCCTLSHGNAMLERGMGRKEVYGKHHHTSFEGGWAGKFTLNFVLRVRIY